MTSHKQKHQQSKSTTQQLSTLSDGQRESALEKYHIIEPYLHKERTLKSICCEHNIPLKTGSNWVSRYRKDGLFGLARKSRRDKGDQRSYSEKVKTFIEGLYLQKPHLSKASVYRQVKKHATQYQEPVPSYRTVCTILDNIPKPIITLAHEGQAAYKQQYDLLYIRETNGPNDIWQADHALLDILIIDDKHETGNRKQALAHHCF